VRPPARQYLRTGKEVRSMIVEETIDTHKLDRLGTTLLSNPSGA
jgi:hypothetical protein